MTLMVIANAIAIVLVAVATALTSLHSGHTRSIVNKIARDRWHSTLPPE